MSDGDLLCQTRGNFQRDGRECLDLALALCILRNTSAITANDDPSRTKQLEGKARWATATTCYAFELLRKAGLPVAYIKKLSPTAFLAKKCRMILLECVVRRLAVGSYLKRFPNIEPPHRFHRLVMEFFLKTTGGKMVGSVSKTTSAVVTDDPDSSSSKMKKARELGVPIWSEAELLKRLS